MSGFSSLMPTTTTPLGFISSATFVRCGMPWRHGPHQVAQNSSTYTLPGSKKVGFSPRMKSEISGSGALEPMVRAGAAGAGCAGAR